MRIRMKISYEACKRAVSILELFLTAILKTYKKLTYKLIFDSQGTNSEEESFKEDIIEDELIYKDENKRVP